MYPATYLAIRSCIYLYIRGLWFESSQVAASLCASTPCSCCIIHPFIYSHSHLSIHPSTHSTSTEVCGSNPVGWLYLVGHLLLAPATTSRRLALVVDCLLNARQLSLVVDRLLNAPQLALVADCLLNAPLAANRCLLSNPIHVFIASSVNPSIFVCPHRRLAPECMSRHNRAVGGHLWDQLGIVSNMCSGTRCEETLFGLVLNRQGNLTGYKSRRQVK